MTVKFNQTQVIEVREKWTCGDGCCVSFTTETIVAEAGQEFNCAAGRTTCGIVNIDEIPAHTYEVVE